MNILKNHQFWTSFITVSVMVGGCVVTATKMTTDIDKSLSVLKTNMDGRFAAQEIKIQYTLQGIEEVKKDVKAISEKVNSVYYREQKISATEMQENGRRN